MKIESNTKETIFMVLMLILLLLAIFLQLSNVKYFSKATLDRLQNENRELLQKNNTMLHQMDSLKKENIMLDEALGIVVKNDSILQKNLDSITNKVNQIRSLYEKAKRRPDNFSSDSLLWYFSNI